MVDVIMLKRFKNYNSEDSYFASYNIGNIKSWIFVNIDDFYSWLERADSDYYKEVRSRHFFFKKYSIVEDFNSEKSERAFKAKQVLNSYFECCRQNNGLQDFAKMIDLQSMSPVFRDVQLRFVAWSDPFLSLVDNDYMFKKFGRNWYSDLIADARKHNLEFFDDGAGHLFPHYNCRTLFYDSGSSREMQFDRVSGRENVNSSGLK